MKTAVILFNLGGPDTPEAIRPFLRNLFSDKRIIGLPAPLRQLLAWVISTSRAPKVKPLYAEMGGASPILPNTQAQANALQKLLPDARVFLCMRYWRPRAAEVVKAVKEYAPGRIVLLPLYPQFSTTTTESSMVEWQQEAERQGLNVPTESVCCYPAQAGFISALTELITPHLAHPNLRILFSAHGLPQKIIDRKGDPYVAQVEMTAKAVVEALSVKGLDWRISYQSRVGPVAWVKPYTDAEIRQAGAEKKHLMLVPIAFVSEHIETLVELDIENKHLALESGCVGYTRIPTVSTHPAFIAGLAALVQQPTKPNLCPADRFACPCKLQK